jgi:O-methyltransferase
MTSDERLLAVIDAARYLRRYHLTGAVVECGVWKGGSTMAAALALLADNAPSRDLYLYDTFAGMSAPTEADNSFDGASAAEQLRHATPQTGLWCYAGLDEVRANVSSTGYPADKLHFVQGRVEDTIPTTVPAAIALLRLDTDWYESTRHELIHLFPRLVPGGILIIDDYGHWQGSRRATDEYFAAQSTPIYFQRLDYTGRIAVKI